mmetsp:Transcript_4178/g.10044  ORF Transcript_4178/g.10044 Transcript_4178/m.10044 type:complete len:256 (-) Transcript_4178:346-1113(-)
MLLAPLSNCSSKRRLLASLSRRSWSPSALTLTTSSLASCSRCANLASEAAALAIASALCSLSATARANRISSSEVRATSPWSCVIWPSKALLRCSLTCCLCSLVVRSTANISSNCFSFCAIVASNAAVLAAVLASIDARMFCFATCSLVTTWESKKLLSFSCKSACFSKSFNRVVTWARSCSNSWIRTAEVASSLRALANCSSTSLRLCSLPCKFCSPSALALAIPSLASLSCCANRASNAITCSTAEARSFVSS